MAQNDIIDWLGKSGTTYRYWFAAVPTRDGLQAVSGNYAFVKRQASGLYVPLYFGETNDLSARIPGHEMWSAAVRLGATDVMAHTTPAGEAARLAEERDLIQYWNPLLNSQHRSAG